MSEAVRTVTVVGLGRMGLALAGAVARAGHTVTVWNRTASRAEPLREQGVAVADTVASACSASDVVIVCLADYDANGLCSTTRAATLVRHWQAAVWSR